MKFVIDAKMEKGQPRLRVLDAETGSVHMEWSLTRVNEMLEEGEIPPKDFLHPERYGMNLLLKNLFLLSCIESMSVSNNNGWHSDNKILEKDIIKNPHANDSDWYFRIKVGPV